MSVKNLVKSALVLTVLFMSSMAYAQQPMQKKSPEERAATQTKWMQANLALTDDQTKKSYDIMLKYAQQASNAGPDAQPGDRQQIMANRDAEIKGVLTGAQFQQYQAHEQEMRAKMQQRRGDQ